MGGSNGHKRPKGVFKNSVCRGGVRSAVHRGSFPIATPHPVSDDPHSHRSVCVRVAQGGGRSGFPVAVSRARTRRPAPAILKQERKPTALMKHALLQGAVGYKAGTAYIELIVRRPGGWPAAGAATLWEHPSTGGVSDPLQGGGHGLMWELWGRIPDRPKTTPGGTLDPQKDRKFSFLRFAARTFQHVRLVFFSQNVPKVSFWVDWWKLSGPALRTG